MMKKIYDIKTNSSSFYEKHSFCEFLDSQEARLIMTNELRSKHVYWFEGKNVMLYYAPRPFDNTSLTLYGDEQGIGEVEKIILEAAKAHDSKNGAKPASP